MIAPLTMALGAAAGSAVGAGIQGIGNVASGSFGARRDIKKMYKDSYNKYKAGKFGMTKEEMRKAMDQSKALINQSADRQNEEIRRGTAASGIGGPKDLSVIGAQQAIKAEALAGARTDLQRASEEKAARQYEEMRNLQATMAGASSPLATGLGKAAEAGVLAGVTQAIEHPESTRSGQQQSVAHESTAAQTADAGFSKDRAARYQDLMKKLFSNSEVTHG